MNYRRIQAIWHGNCSLEGKLEPVKEVLRIYHTIVALFLWSEQDPAVESLYRNCES